MAEQVGDPNLQKEPSCVNCGGSGHWAYACHEPTRESTAGFEAWRSSSHGANRNGKDHNRGGNRRSSAPIITRYAPPSTQDFSNFPPPGYNPAPPAPYLAPPNQGAPPLPSTNLEFTPYNPQPPYSSDSYPPGYQMSLPATPLSPSYGPPPPGHKLGYVPIGTTVPPPMVQADQDGYQPQVPAGLYSQFSGSYLPAPQSVYSELPGLAQAPGLFGGVPMPENVPGRYNKNQFSGRSKPKKQAPQSKPLPSGEGLKHALPPRPPIKKLPPAYLIPKHLPSENQNRLDGRRNQRSQKHQERILANRERGNQNGGANNRRNSGHRKQNVSNKSNSPRFRKRFRDGAPAEDAKSVTTAEVSPSRLDPEDKSNEASTPPKTPELEPKDGDLSPEGGSSNQEVTEPHEQSNVSDQPKENSDDVKDASLNSDGGDVKTLPRDDTATELVSKDAERAETVEKDLTAITEQKASADKPDVKQECSDEANPKTLNTVEESIERQQMGRKRRHTDEQDDSPQDRLMKRRKSSEAEGLPPKEPLQVNETNNGPQSSEDSSLPVLLEEQLPSNRRDSILSGGSRPTSRRSSVSSRSSGLDSLEAELLGLPSKGKSKTETKGDKKRADGRGIGKKRQPNVNSAYSRRW